jgi:hypothetical protein
MHHEKRRSLDDGAGGLCHSLGRLIRPGGYGIRFHYYNAIFYSPAIAGLFLGGLLLVSLIFLSILQIIAMGAGNSLNF